MPEKPHIPFVGQSKPLHSVQNFQAEGGLCLQGSVQG